MNIINDERKIQLNNGSKRQSILGCGCLLIIILFFAGCVGSCMNPDTKSTEEEDSKKTNQNTSSNDSEIKQKEQELKEKEKALQEKEQQLKEKELKQKEDDLNTQAHEKQSVLSTPEEDNTNNQVSTKNSYNETSTIEDVSTEAQQQINKFSSTSSDDVRNYDDDSNKGTGTPSATYYPNCSAARAAGAAPISVGQPGYGTHLDRDGDGIGCDK